MARSPVLKYLVGPDRRSIGNAALAVKLVSSHPAIFPDLLSQMWSADLLVRMRAADAVEKVTRGCPELLQPYKRKLLLLADRSAQQEMQWHLAQVLPRLALTDRERQRAVRAMKDYLESESSIVKTCALQALFELSRNSVPLRSRTEKILRKATRTGTPAMRARARRLLALLRRRPSAADSF